MDNPRNTTVEAKPSNNTWQTPWRDNKPTAPPPPTPSPAGKTCHRCGSLDHFVRDCTKFQVNVLREDDLTETEEIMLMKEPEKFWKGKVRERLCFECGDPNHFKAQCPKLMQTQPPTKSPAEMSPEKKEIQELKKQMTTLMAQLTGLLLPEN